MTDTFLNPYTHGSIDPIFYPGGGGGLRLNALADSGNIRVERLDREDRPLPGYSIIAARVPLW